MLGGSTDRPAIPAHPKPVEKKVAPVADNVLVPDDSWFAIEAPEGSTAFPGTCSIATVSARDRSLGTALTWARSPEEAAEQAKQSGKLVLLLHVSGNFENPGFT